MFTFKRTVCDVYHIIMQSLHLFAKSYLKTLGIVAGISLFLFIDRYVLYLLYPSIQGAIRPIHYLMLLFVIPMISASCWFTYARIQAGEQGRFSVIGLVSRHYLTFLLVFIIGGGGAFLVYLYYGSYLNSALLQHGLLLLLLIWITLASLCGAFVVIQKKSAWRAFLHSSCLSFRYWGITLLSSIIAFILFVVGLKLTKYLVYKACIALIAIAQPYSATISSFYTIVDMILPAFFIIFLYAFHAVLYKELIARQ